MAIRPNDRAIAARVLRDAGHHNSVIAGLFNVSESQVRRYLQAQPTVGTPDQLAVDDLEALIATQELDQHGKFQAGVARRLATRLDKVSVSDKAADAMAMPQIAKELRAVVAEIMGASQDDKEWLAGLFTQVADASHA